MPSNPLNIITRLLEQSEFAAYTSSDPFFHDFIALRLRPTAASLMLMSSEFDFVFKSRAVAETFHNQMLTQTVTEIASVYKSLRLLPGGSLLAGQLFANFSLSRMTAMALAILRPMYYESGPASSQAIHLNKD
jgi:hypothetical protein